MNFQKLPKDVDCVKNELICAVDRYKNRVAEVMRTRFVWLIAMRETDAPKDRRFVLFADIRMRKSCAKSDGDRLPRFESVYELLRVNIKI